MCLALSFVVSSGTIESKNSDGPVHVEVSCAAVKESRFLTSFGMTVVFEFFGLVEGLLAGRVSTGPTWF
jgi:hypothetical protein